MVFKHPETGLKHFSVDGSRLLKDGGVIATLDTAICQLARLDDRMFVLLDPYPAERDPNYAGTNLWCLSDHGNLLWKAQNLNQGFVPSRWSEPNCYRRMRFFNPEKPAIVAATWEDRLAPFIDIKTGQFLPGNNLANPINHLIFYEPEFIAWLSPNEPPRPPRLPESTLG